MYSCIYVGYRVRRQWCNFFESIGVEFFSFTSQMNKIFKRFFVVFAFWSKTESHDYTSIFFFVCMTRCTVWRGSWSWGFFNWTEFGERLRVPGVVPWGGDEGTIIRFKLVRREREESVILVKSGDCLLVAAKSKVDWCALGSRERRMKMRTKTESEGGWVCAAKLG